MSIKNEPQSRTETILENMLGEEYEVKPPQSRVEILLQKLSEGGTGGLSLHVCVSGEYNPTTFIPTIQNPDANTLYLVPVSADSGNMYDEYVYVNNTWEKFGSGKVVLPENIVASTLKLGNTTLTEADIIALHTPAEGGEY